MIRPLTKQLFIEPIFDSDYYNPSSQLIKIPSFAKERCDQGIVKYVGADCDPAIKVGSHVIFSGYTGTTIAIDNELLIVMHSDFIKCIVDVDNYVVPGLYYKGRVSFDKLFDHTVIGNTLFFTREELEKFLINFVALYQEELLIPATYEQSVSLLRDAHAKFQLEIKPDINPEQRDPIDERNR